MIATTCPDGSGTPSLSLGICARVLPQRPIHQVKKAYCKLALIHHPDKNQQCKVAAARFLEIADAYEVTTLKPLTCCHRQLYEAVPTLPSILLSVVIHDLLGHRLRYETQGMYGLKIYISGVK